jgi:hypothetical protein
LRPSASIPSIVDLQRRILVNHLAEAGPRRLLEQSFAPVARRLGWRPEFRWQAAGGATAASPANAAQCRRSAISR